VPAAIFAIQTCGRQLNWHPRLHSLLADAAWGKNDDAFQPKKAKVFNIYSHKLVCFFHSR